MGFTNITPGCTGFHSSSLTPVTLFSVVSLSVAFYCALLSILWSSQKNILLFNFPSPSTPPFFAAVLCFETFAETGVRTEGDTGFQCWIGWSLPPFFTARQAPCSTWNAFGFTQWTAAIFLPLITSGLGTSVRHIPRPMDDPQGKANGNQPSLTLLRHFLGITLREREQDSKVIQRVGTRGQKTALLLIECMLELVPFPKLNSYLFQIFLWIIWIWVLSIQYGVSNCK